MPAVSHNGRKPLGRMLRYGAQDWSGQNGPRPARLVPKPVEISPRFWQNGRVSGPTRWGIGTTDMTRILNAIERGDAGAANQLLPALYDELRLRFVQKRWCARLPTIPDIKSAWVGSYRGAGRVGFLVL